MRKSPHAKVKGRSRFLLQLPEGLTLLQLHLELASRSGDHASLWSEQCPVPFCSCSPTELTQETPCPRVDPQLHRDVSEMHSGFFSTRLTPATLGGTFPRAEPSATCPQGRLSITLQHL